MAKMSKKKRNTIIGIVIGIVLFLTVGRAFISKWRLRGTWNGQTWDQITAQYPGIAVSLAGQVTVPNRNDLVGTLSGNTITWNNGQVWTRS